MDGNPSVPRCQVEQTRPYVELSQNGDRYYLYTDDSGLIQ